jgi:hypothetical protein
LWLLASVVALATAPGLAVASDRVIEAAIIGVLLLPPLAFLSLWIVAWRRGQLDG